MPKGRQLQKGFTIGAQPSTQDVDESGDAAALPVAQKPMWQHRLEVLEQKHPELYGYAKKFAFRFGLGEEGTAVLIEKFIAEALSIAAEESRVEKLHQRYLAAKE